MKKNENQNRKMNRKAQETTTVIVFITLVIAVLIAGSWYIKTLRPTSEIIDTVTDDMSKFQYFLNFACQSDNLRTEINPRLTSGNLSLSSDQFCIETLHTAMKCVNVLCNTGISVNYGIDMDSLFIIEKKTSEDGKVTFELREAWE